MEQRKPNKHRQKTRQRRQGAKPAEKAEDAAGYALWYLNKFGEISEATLREKLKNKTDKQEWIDFAINKMIDLGYQSDSRYAEMIVRQGMGSKAWGRSRIEQELKRKGVPSDIAEEALAVLCDDDPTQRAKEALGKKFRERPIAEQKDRAKATRFLAARGFGFNDISTAISRHNEQIEEI